MTFSIVARCPDTGQLGVAAATGMPGVGKLVTYARPGHGAVATQSWINPYLGVDGIRLLAEGHDAQSALDRALELDEDRRLRQVAVCDAAGGVAAWTGPGCADWAGHLTGEGWSVQGNLLVGADTVERCAAVFAELVGLGLAQRFMAALEAGEQAGGDQRGLRSATVYVVDTEDYPLWDLRVDDHAEPLAELRRMFDVFAAELIPQIRKLPTRRDAHGGIDPASRAGLA